jgi:hypothetical protein
MKQSQENRGRRRSRRGGREGKRRRETEKVGGKGGHDEM